MDRLNTEMKIGLALSGGGARGIAHIGVIQALQERGIELDMIGGVSAGSIIGALYASGCTLDEMLSFVESSTFLKIVRPEIKGPGLANLNRLIAKLSQFIKVERIEELHREMVIITTNLNQGESVVFKEGPLMKTILASCSIPLIFRPVEIDEHLFVDGGLLMNLPVDPLKKTCDLVIGSSVIPTGYRSNEQLKSLSQVGYRCFELAIRRAAQDQYDRCDILIEPIGTEQFTIFQFDKTQELFELGYGATHKQIDKIEAWIEEAGSGGKGT